MLKTYLGVGAAFSVAAGLSFGETKMESGNGWLKFTGGDGPGKGKHVVLLAGDEEYRSEESMPMMAKILTERHGFDTTVLFSADADGTINPEAGGSLENPESLDSADALVMLLRFRHYSDETMNRFKAAVDRGVPLVALRTSTHVFNFPKDSAWAKWAYNNENGGFGKTVLGETWISHWGKHKVEATRGMVEKGQEENPVLNGVADVFGDSDVYEAAPPEDATVLLRGVVLKGMEKDGQPADYSKKRRDGVEQKVNEPAMPVAWTRERKNEAGTTNKILTTTMGAATDLESEGLRRLVVNGVFWGLGLDIPEKADVSVVGAYKPTDYGFSTYKKGLKSEDFAK